MPAGELKKWFSNVAEGTALASLRACETVVHFPGVFTIWRVRDVISSRCRQSRSPDHLGVGESEFCRASMLEFAIQVRFQSIWGGRADVLMRVNTPDRFMRRELDA